MVFYLIKIQFHSHVNLIIFVYLEDEMRLLMSIRCDFILDLKIFQCV